jgi:integrase
MAGDPGSNELQISDKTQNPLEALSAILTAAGIDAKDLEIALDAVKEAKNHKPSNNANDKKFFKDKIPVYPDVEAFIFKRGNSKSGIYYLRIYDENNKKPIIKSLKTADSTKALAKARIIFMEITGKISRGERLKQITTKELIIAYDKSLKQIISEVPQQGITPENYRLKIYFLKNWNDYINNSGFENTTIDKISPEKTRNFGSWLLAKPKIDGSQRSRELINNNIGEVLRMYNQIAIRDKYISKDHIPEIDRLRSQPDEGYKRDILTEEQYQKYRNYLEWTYERERKEINDQERLKRRIFRGFIEMLYNLGARPKELLGLRLSEITSNPKWKDIEKEDNAIVLIRKENSKTGKSRKPVAPIKKCVDRILKAYAALGVKQEPGDYLFMNPESKDRKAYCRQNMYQRLKKSLSMSGLQDELNKEGKSITLYSGRHSYATWRLRHGDVPILLLAKQMGTSVQKIESTYGHIDLEMQSAVITKGQDHIKRTAIVFTPENGKEIEYDPDD